MNVGLLTSLERGGPLEHAIVLAGALVRSGAGVRAVCASTDAAERFAAAGADPVVLPLRHQLDVPHGIAARRALTGVAVVHAQDRRAGLWTRLLPRPAGARRVYTVHGLPDPYLPPPAGPRRPSPRARLAYRGLDAALARRADAIVTPSQAVARALVERLGFPPGRLTVIPNGVEVPEAQRTPGEAVGTVSVLEPVKGIGTFLDAAARLADRHPSIPFAVFGTGSEERRLRARAHALGLDGRLAMPGFVPAREALAQLRVFVLPSLMENCPMALLEAMAAGVPAVATRVGGVPELVPPGTARLVAPGDAAALAGAVEELLADPGAAAAQAAAARDHVERHGTATLMAERMCALYRRLLAA